jgi:anti-sigma regulatory factor (Ser/Thr protein kinase)
MPGAEPREGRAALAMQSAAVRLSLGCPGRCRVTGLKARLPEHNALSGERLMADTWYFEADDAVPAQVRRDDFIRFLGTRAAEGSDLESAGTIYVELVANVVRHVGGPIALFCYFPEGYATLCVRDYGRGFAYNKRRAQVLSESGRGLYIVSALARRLDVDSGPWGCEVCAVLPVRKGP